MKYIDSILVMLCGVGCVASVMIFIHERTQTSQSLVLWTVAATIQSFRAAKR